MSAYIPHDMALALIVAGLSATNVLWGFIVAKMPVTFGRLAAWGTLGLGVAAVHTLLEDEPAGFRMIALIVFALLSMKTIVVVEAQARGGSGLTLSQWIAFSAGWLGMRPRLFSAKKPVPVAGAKTLIAKGAVRFAVGLAFTLSAWGVWQYSASFPATSLLLLIGLSLMLHFGLCNMLTGFWRTQGFQTDVLFRAPLHSQCLGEFWAQRWNLAFSQMTSIAVHRPLAGKFGNRIALAVAFLVSGLLHEMAISLPVKEGFGSPLLYFCIHGVLVSVEKSLAKKGNPIRGAIGTVWTVFWLIVPIPLLFHRPFLEGVILPIVGAASPS
jgi:hypothetical protein